MATLIGHGRAGLQDRLEDFIDIVGQSSNEKISVVVLKPIKVVENWSQDDPQGSYVVPFEVNYGALRLDVVGVKSLLDPKLERVETLADCRSTPGTYFYDVDEEFDAGAAWDAYAVEETHEHYKWDDGVSKWDQFTQLFIHLSDSSNPNNTTVIVQLGFYYANKGIVQPELGSDKLLNGSFADWTDGDLDDWINTATGVAKWDDSTPNWDDVGAQWDPIRALMQEGMLFRRGSKSLAHHLEYSSSKTIQHAQSISCVNGAYYRISGYYLTTADQSKVQAQFAVDDGTNFIMDDGRHRKSSSNLINLQDTGVEWRHFFFDFRAWATSLNFTIKGAWVADPGGIIYWDFVKVQRIYRYNFCEPRLSAASVPRINTASNDIFFGGKTIGSGSVSIINSDGRIERLVGSYEWGNQEVAIYSGLASVDGQEIPFNDYRQSMVGLIQRIKVNDDEVTFALQDIRAFFHRLLPTRVYDDVTFPNMDISKYLGASRPVFFGAKNNITPIRIDKTSEEYGVYEICDTEKSPNGIKSVDAVYAYADSQSAAAKNSTLRVSLTKNVDYTEDLVNGQITIITNVGPFVIEDDNDSIDFDDGGGAEFVEVSAGVYTALELAAAIKAAMETATADTITVAYSDVTHKFTISTSGGTLSLLAKTGSNNAHSIFTTIGFARNTDKTGATSYEAESAVFDDVDKDHIIRVNAQGYKDDSLGTYTGTANALIQIGADITRVLLIKFMGKSTNVIDEDSFVFARERAPETLAIYLKSPTSTKDIFDNLEFSNIANIVVNGEGKVFYKVYVGDIPTGIKTVDDAAIEDFEGEKSVTDVYSGIRIKYDQDPSSNRWPARQADDASTSVRLGRPDIKEFETYIRFADNADNTAKRMLELARSAARKFSVETVGGEFIDLEVGDKVKVSRRRAMAASGKLDSEVFRIISISKQQQDGVVSMDVTDDRVTVASNACINTCQQFCQTSCQEGCQQECQNVCETAGCQGPCESTCEEACQDGCQETCELDCQVGCETGSCQDTCQQTCQACEGAGCQTSCQMGVCQDACQQGSCQTVCQTGPCQGPCQSNCQEDCQLVDQTPPCQTVCETQGCQETCQLTCQIGCQLGCQSDCQGGSCQFPSEGI